MDPGALKARYRRWLLQEWGDGNRAVAGELIAEGLVDHNRPQGQPAGRLAGEVWMAKMIRTALPGATCQAAAKRPTARLPRVMRSAGCLGHRAGKLMMTTRMHAHPDRIQNLEMAGETFGPDAACLDRSAKRWRKRNSGRRGAGSGQGAYFRTRSPASGSAAPAYRLAARPGSGRICTRAQITHICAS